MEFDLLYQRYREAGVAKSNAFRNKDETAKSEAKEMFKQIFEDLYL